MKKINLFLFLMLWLLPVTCMLGEKVKVTKPGTLSTLLTKAQQDTIKHLIISGKLNSADIKVLRRMAGAEGGGSLQTLDMSRVRITECYEPYLVINNAEEKILPWIDVGLESMNGMEGRSPDPYPPYGPRVEVYNANFILPDGSEGSKLTEEEISESMSPWKILTGRKLHIKGHRVEKKKDGHYTYSAFTRKKLFCEDMFYHCPNIKVVIIPNKGKLHDKVRVVGGQIRFMKVAKVVKG